MGNGDHMDDSENFVMGVYLISNPQMDVPKEEAEDKDMIPMHLRL